jgi:hypothetical protein
LFGSEQFGHCLHCPFFPLKIFKELEDKGEVTIINTRDNKTLITFTKKGLKICEAKLEELHTLNEYFYSYPLEQRRYDEEQGKDVRLAKGLKFESLEPTAVEITVDKLIKSISNW